MRLLRLEASGFKSFCDKTVINFVQNGISVVVGPNGCGKSNIVDAVRWTLGEQSAKHLRGSSMEDVIFNGSSGRQPVSVAQVTLVFSNPEHDTIPRYSEFSEIAVTRRLYRSGESQYLINKTACRLTDIRELFMDTGIGGKGYSIIEQGKIDQIITSRAEDRRLIIDEAAGIVKFKTKRKEAERKFEATRQNLLRVEDVLAELVTQEESLRYQVERAEEYLAAKSRLERLQNCITATRWHRLKEQADRVVQNREKTLEQKSDLETEITVLESRESALSMDISRKNAEIEEIGTTIHSLKETIIKLESKLESNKVALENLDEWEDKNKAEIELLEKQIKTLEFQSESNRSDRESLEKEIQEKRTLMERLRERDESNDGDLSSQRLRLENLQQKEMEITTSISSHKNQIENLRERLDEVEEKAKNLGLQTDSVKADEEKSAREFEELSKSIEKKKQEKKELVEKARQYSEQKEEKEQFINELNRKIKSQAQDLNQTENRLQSLEEFILSHEEYDAATQKILQYMSQHPETAKELGYLGSMAEIVNLPREITPQTSAFLNRYFNLLVFKSVDRLESIVNLVREEGFEQFHLCFLDLFTEEDSKKDHSLAEVITGKDEVVSSIPFVESFETLDVPVHTLSKEQLLASSGLIDPEASIMTKARLFLLGQPGKSNLAETYIKRRNEIAQLEKQQTLLKQQLEATETQADGESEVLEELSRSLKKVQGDIVDIDLEMVALEKEYDGKLIEQQRIETMKNSMDREIREVYESRKQFETKIGQLEKSIKDDAQKQETINKVCGELKAQIEKSESSREETREELQHIKITLAGMDEKRANYQETIDRLQKDIAEKKRQQEDIQNRAQETENKRRAAKDSLLQAREEHPRLLEQLTEKEKAIAELKDNLQKMLAEQTEHRKNIKEANQNISSLKEKNHKLEIKLAQLSQEATNLEDNLFNESSLKPEDLLQTFDVKQFNIEKESETIADLKKTIGGMDDVNLAAKSEYETLKERLDFLSTQSKDLTQSMEALESSINKMNQESRRRFRQTFKQVNEEFSKLFPQLFGGGEAYLKLTDETDLLESGVDIIAQPPGKKLQNMTLLSGGEKALTALALVFAVFMIKPSPFCLLDEVDAPLDDSNNIRFNRHVKALTENSQFIIITHNKKTMEIGDALFGITMEEPGISKVVSVDFATFSPDSLQKAG